MVSREDRLLNSLRSRPQIQAPIAPDMFIPNYSGLTHIKQHNYDLTLINPKGVYASDHEVFIAITKLPIIITKLQVTLAVNTNEVAGDLKYCDSFLTQANSVLINSFDTTNGLMSADINVAVNESKCLYLTFDSEPNVAIVQMHIHIEYVEDCN